MNNQTDVSIKFKNSVTGEEKLKRYAATLGTIKSLLDGMDKGTIKQLENGSKGLSDIKNGVKKVTKDTDKLGKQLKTAFDITLITKFSKALGNTYRNIVKFTNASMNYVESLNLYQVAFEGDTKEADKFINKLAEMYGLDENWLTRTVSMFKQLSNAMGLSADTGKKLSKALTQLSIDTSSLYNIEPSEAVSKFSSALAGQTKPVRSLGADITQTTLQQTLTNLGIDKSIVNLSYAEKRLTIVISLMQQLSKVTNDWGKTIESPANQTRILSEQWERLTRSVGNIFLPVLTKILPYLNAILMVLTEIINAIAALLGFNIKDFDYGVGVSTDALDDFAGELDNATGSSEKLKNSLKGLRSFDKLNVIKTPADDGAASGSGTGISSDILGAFDKTYAEYMSKLEDVEMKATRIRDRIMEWLGFTKKADKETGKISFKFDHITGGTALGALAVGGAIYNGVKTIFKLLNKIGLIDFTLPSIASLIGKGAEFTGLTELLSSISVGWELIAAGEASVGSVITELILPALGEFALALGGIVLAVGGIALTFKGISDIIKNGWNFDAIMESLEGIGLIVSGILMFINPIAGLIALAVTGLIALTKVIVDNWDTIKENVINPIVDFVTSIATTIYDKAIKPVLDFFVPIVDAIVSIFTTIFKNIADIVTGVANAAWSIIKKVGEILAKIVEIFVALAKAFYDYVIKPVWNNYIKPAFEAIYKAVIKPIVDLFKKVGTWFYNNVIKPVWDKIVWLKDKAVSIFKSIGTTVVNFVGDSIKSVINGVLAGIEWTINKFISMLNGAIRLINKIPGVNITRVEKLSIPRLEKGMDFVPKDFYGPVYLDYGERVLTKDQNKDYIANKNVGDNLKGMSYSGTFNIYVGSEKVATTVLKELKNMSKSNGKPIEIRA